MEKKISPQQKYDKSHTTFVGLKLNNTTDADILVSLEGKQKQTESDILPPLAEVGASRSTALMY